MQLVHYSSQFSVAFQAAALLAIASVPSTSSGCSCGNNGVNKGEFCYHVVENVGGIQTNWTGAKEKCEKIGATLPVIKSASDDNRTSEVMDQLLRTNLGVWLGLSDTGCVGRWLWNDNTKAAFFKWHIDEPNKLKHDHYKNANCVVKTSLQQGGFWLAIACYAQIGDTLCQKPCSGVVTKPVDKWDCADYRGANENISYVMAVKTNNTADAESSARLYVRFTNELGEKTDEHAFGPPPEAGIEVEFSFNAKDIGKIANMIIKHNSDYEQDDWSFSTFKLQIPSRKEEYHFGSKIVKKDNVKIKVTSYEGPPVSTNAPLHTSHKPQGHGSTPRPQRVPPTTTTQSIIAPAKLAEATKPNEDSSLSPEEWIGIVAGVSILLALLALIAFFVVKKKRSTDQSKKSSAAGQAPLAGANLPAKKIPNPAPPLLEQEKPVASLECNDEKSERSEKSAKSEKSEDSVDEDEESGSASESED